MMATETPKANLKGRSLPREEWPEQYLKPISASLSSLVNHDAPISLAEGNWYAVCTEARQETLAKEEIGKRGLIPYLALEPRRERHGRGQLRTVDRAIITSYIFVKCYPFPEYWHRITGSRGVKRILADIGGTPLAVPDGAIEALRLFEAVQRESENRRIREQEAEEAYQAELKAAQEQLANGKLPRIVWHFSEGDRVRIKRGPFATFYARLEAAPDQHAKVKALMDIFGRPVRTELSAFEIERAQDAEGA